MDREYIARLSWMLILTGLSGYSVRFTYVDEGPFAEMYSRSKLRAHFGRVRMDVEVQKKRRRRVKQTLPLGERLLKSAREARAAAAQLPPGLDQARLLRRAREAEAIAQLEHFLRGSGRYPPRES